MKDPDLELYWDSTYAIVLALMEHHPNQKIDELGYDDLAKIVEALPGFNDDPTIVTNRILDDILIVWYEEASTL